MEQRSEEWFQARLGKATASRFKDVLATIKSGESASRRNYRAELVVERLTGQRNEVYQNAAMAWGTETELLAKVAYEVEAGVLVEEQGFIVHPELMAGASPDGFVGEDGGIEIKCPFQTAVHIETLQKGMPKEHMAQVQGCMWLSGRKWWDFVSYDPRLPDDLQLYVERIHRDEKYISNLEESVTAFLQEVEDTVNQLKNRKAA